jgi:hypothetical protein
MKYCMKLLIKLHIILFIKQLTIHKKCGKLTSGVSFITPNKGIPKDG